MRRFLLCIIVATLLGGCTVGPNYHQPQTVVPTSFVQSTTQPAVASIDLAEWWQALHDTELDSLLQRATAANFDLAIAVERLQEARATQSMVVGDSLPDVEASVAAGRGSGTNSTKGRISAPLNAASNTTGLREITQILGFDAAWELDLFGHLRRQVEAAKADTAAAADYRDQVLVTLLADVARNYYEVRTLQLRLDIARQAIDVQQRSADLARIKYERGMVNQLDEVLAERELARVQATLAPLQADLAAAQRRVAVLLGMFPEELRDELNRTAPLPTPPVEIAAGLPGEMLRRRPDVRQAESQLIAANAQIGVATANLYPQILLTAGLGYQGQGLGRTPVSWDSIWSVGPAVRWPLLDFGSVDAAIQAQDYQTRALAINYRKTVVLAMEEVDNGLSGYDAQRSRLADLSRAVTAAQLAVSLATQRYDRGLTDFLNVLDAQRQLYDLQDQYALSEDQTVTQFISVCKALGGGWEGCPLPSPPRAPRPAIIAAGADALSRR
jgi:NodT family efflux transporter outer membrane factor (OMF) lipoprotein